MPTISTESGAHHYRLIGLEVSIAGPNPVYSYGILNFGTHGSTTQDTLEEQPHHLILDRSYVHGLPDAEVRCCVSLHAAHTAVIDSYIEHCYSGDTDAQGIAGWNGTGPIKIVNNYIAGAAENIAFGGADPMIPGINPSDIEIRYNHLHKPPEWRTKCTGGRWLVKNHFETKAGVRILFEGNVLENLPTGDVGQPGFAIVLKTVNAENRAPWSQSRDIIIRYNRIVNTGGGLAIMGVQGIETINEGTRRVVMRDNVWQHYVNSGRGGFVQIDSSPSSSPTRQLRDLVIEHNTAYRPATYGNIELMDGSVFIGSDTMNGAPEGLDRTEGFVLRNNILSSGDYFPIYGQGASGVSALDRFTPGAVVTGNIFIGGNGQLLPPGNFTPSDLASVGFIDPQAESLRLPPSNPYRGPAATDRDPGADIAKVEMETQGVREPFPPAEPQHLQFTPECGGPAR